MKTIQRALKRAFDIVVAGGCLALLSPVLLAVWAGIRATMGSPVFFRQERLGRHGRAFTMLKFRTMTDERDDGGRLLPDAQRLTRLGVLLRSLTLDELPELINVLRGEMSVVGPRPLLPEYRDRYSAEQWRRHEVAPGMAGPVMARGRNALTWGEKFALDVAYVDDWSLWLDMKILATSMWKLLRREGVSAEGHATMPVFEGRSADKDT